MSKAKVYFSDLRTRGGVTLPEKLNKLIDKAGMGNIDFKDKFVAIKIHFGELGNLAYLRPNYAKVVVDYIKARGGKAFLTDCNTLYVGSRKNALDHMDTAYENGFSPFSTGCHVVIADGLKGSDDVEVPVPGGHYVKNAKIGRAVMDADIIISLNHFKGHEATGFGGALKNLGMGCGSRRGKMEMHNAGKPTVHQKNCVGCGICLKQCAHSAITITAKKAAIDHAKCVGCGRCIAQCPKDAINGNDDEANDILNAKIAEYAKAVVQNRPEFHISLVIDISPYCDCHAENDLPILPDVGMFASFDAVALDIACADACNRQPVIPGSHLAECKHVSDDNFINSHPTTDWKTSIAHAKKLGIGTDEYEIIEV
jgi:Uncharacterized Fe-S center protein